jgi:hypothetical protein
VMFQFIAQFRIALALPQPGVQHVVQDLEQPRSHPTLAQLECARGLQRVQISLLHEIFDLMRAMAKMMRQPIHRRQLSERELAKTSLVQDPSQQSAPDN